MKASHELVADQMELVYNLAQGKPVTFNETLADPTTKAQTCFWCDGEISKEDMQAGRYEEGQILAPGGVGTGYYHPNCHEADQLVTAIDRAYDEWLDKQIYGEGGEQQ